MFNDSQDASFQIWKNLGIIRGRQTRSLPVSTENIPEDREEEEFYRWPLSVPHSKCYKKMCSGDIQKSKF